jgi:hypothetical protein
MFFADHPIFVEGVSDAQFIEAIQERREASITAAGSCLIDVGGCEELTKYVALCRWYAKEAYFLFDLDSLFLGSLRHCIRDDGAVTDFLAHLGLGSDFSIYCGALDRELTNAVRMVEAANENGPVGSLKAYFRTLDDNPKRLPRQRVAVLVAMADDRAALVSIMSEKIVADIEGRLRQVQAALMAKHIFLLGRGALEHYLPSFSGDRFALSDGAKKAAVAAEVDILASGRIDDSLEERYGELFKCIAALPAKPPVDIESVLSGYVSAYIHDLQGLVINNPDWGKDRIIAHFAASQVGLGKLISLVVFERHKAAEFTALLRIAGPQPRFVEVSHETNAGMRRFKFRLAPEVA